MKKVLSTILPTMLLGLSLPYSNGNYKSATAYNNEHIKQEVNWSSQELKVETYSSTVLRDDKHTVSIRYTPFFENKHKDYKAIITISYEYSDDMSPHKASRKQEKVTMYLSGLRNNEEISKNFWKVSYSNYNSIYHGAFVDVDKVNNTHLRFYFKVYAKTSAKWYNAYWARAYAWLKVHDIEIMPS